MKKLLLLAPLTFLFLLTSSFYSITPEGVSVVVNKGKFKINSQDVAAGLWKLSNFETVLGKADRDRDGYNVTHTYDELSIVLFEPKAKDTPSGTVSEAQFYFKVAEANNVTPNGNGFKGHIQVGKLKVTADLTATELKKALKKWTFTDSYIDHSYRVSQKGIYIYFQFNEAETSLLKVSVGPDKR